MPSSLDEIDDDDDQTDPLIAINAELREKDAPEDDDDPESPWLPLESNPEVFTDFARKSGGLPDDWAWVDIFGLDRGLLSMIPEPCAGVILLFPCTDKIYDARRLEKRRLLQRQQRRAATPATAAAYHVKQVAEFGNACGTIASVHALINGAKFYNRGRGGNGGSGGRRRSALQEFQDGNADASPRDRGKALLKTSALRSSSDQSATHRAAQTETPDRHGPDLDHHFVAFSPIRGDGQDDDDDDCCSSSCSVDDYTNAYHVVELDGTKVLPVDHGSIASILQEYEQQEEGDESAAAANANEEEDAKKHTFLRAVACVIRKHYMEVEPDSIEFSMMALCKIK